MAQVFLRVMKDDADSACAYALRLFDRIRKVDPDKAEAFRLEIGNLKSSVESFIDKSQTLHVVANKQFLEILDRYSKELV